MWPRRRRLPSCYNHDDELSLLLLLLLQVMLNVAKEAPAAFLPHLEALAARVQQLWDAGQLREGEKVRVVVGSPCWVSRTCSGCAAAVGCGAAARGREGAG